MSYYAALGLRPVHKNPELPEERGWLFDNEIERPCGVDEISEWLGVKPATVRAWCSTGRVKIPYFRLGARNMFLKSSVLEWLKSQEIK